MKEMYFQQCWIEPFYSAVEKRYFKNAWNFFEKRISETNDLIRICIIYFQRW